jgi:hypothetical protein
MEQVTPRWHRFTRRFDNRRKRRGSDGNFWISDLPAGDGESQREHTQFA